MIYETEAGGVVNFRSLLILLGLRVGRRQTASQEILDLPCGGSNPPAPASFSAIDGFGGREERNEIVDNTDELVCRVGGLY
jgi:hypothetical protein